MADHTDVAGRRAEEEDTPAEIKRGKDLHREFVGMLFALAIAQVAVEAAEIMNSELGFWSKAPALSHLLLALIVIAASWVGWGRSAYSLSPVGNVFTGDFVELLLDVWLVCIYFFLVQGAEQLVIVQNVDTIEWGSAAVESLWVTVMFWTYFVWDFWTKRNDRQTLRQRGWASFVCAVLSAVAFLALAPVRGSTSAVLADLALIALVLLFRAMKLYDFSSHTRSSWTLIVVLLFLGIVFGIGAQLNLAIP